MKSDLYFLPLGGAGEIGMNLNLYHYEGSWVMVDCGMMISSDFGDDQIYVPDISFLEDKKIDALVLTHAHEDHIGAITDLWMELRCPIYTTPFTAAIVRAKLGESQISERVSLKILPPKSTFDVGPFQFEFLPITHSTVESQAIVIRTQAGVILHTGDWKLDPKPLVGVLTDVDRLKVLGREGILAVVGDSTNAMISGWSGSESSVVQTLAQLIHQEKNRVVCACFSSNIARISSFLEIATQTGRHPVLVGRSLKRMVRAAQDTGYLTRNIPFVPAREAMYLPPNKILLICTGSQGESKAALARISMQSHRDIYLEPDDSIYFSSKIIPGNEKAIEVLQRRFTQKGINVISEESEEIHVSGHPCVDELKQMYEWLAPEVLIPVHGYPPHLIAHAQVGRDCGISHVIEVRNGDLVHLNADRPSIVDQVETGRRLRPNEDVGRQGARQGRRGARQGRRGDRQGGRGGRQGGRGGRQGGRGGR